MGSNRLRSSRLLERLRPVLSIEGLITLLAIVMIAIFYQAATEDRFLLNLYYIGVAGAAYSLLKRGALAMVVVVVAVAAGTTMSTVYFQVEQPIEDPFWDPIRDVTAWCAMLLLSWRLAVDAYRIQSEEHRRRMQREIEEQAIATRAAALTCTSHEVRTPLAAILTITEMMLDDSVGPLNPTQAEFMNEIDRCGKHLLALVNDILDYAKAQAGQIQLSMEKVALMDLIGQCIAISEIPAKRASVKLSMQVDPGVDEIQADPLRVKQILLNLLSNAVKYSPPEGQVRLHARRKGSDVLISVRDTGRGMTEQELSQLFNPYQQASREDRGIGTGLGLAITKLLVELHGGSISVKSAPGCGSVFSVALPLGGVSAPALKGASWSKVTESRQTQDEEAELSAVAV